MSISLPTMLLQRRPLPCPEQPLQLKGASGLWEVAGVELEGAATL